MITYRTKDGDSLDAIVWKFYGRTSGVVEAVLKANPTLADYGPDLPAGLLIILPDYTPPTPEEVTLW